MNLRDHATRDTFHMWFILTLIAERDDIMESLQSGDLTNVPVKLIIGGYEIDAEPALTRLDEEFDHHVDSEAQRLAAQRTDNLADMVRRALYDKLGITLGSGRGEE